MLNIIKKLLKKENIENKKTLEQKVADFLNENEKIKKIIDELDSGKRVFKIIDMGKIERVLINKIYFEEHYNTIYTLVNYIKIKKNNNEFIYNSHTGTPIKYFNEIYSEYDNDICKEIENDMDERILSVKSEMWKEKYNEFTNLNSEEFEKVFGMTKAESFTKLFNNIPVYFTDTNNYDINKLFNDSMRDTRLYISSTRR
jgi:hypothetical protein